MVPLAGPDTSDAVSGWPSKSLSLASTLRTTEVFSSMIALLALATGASLTAVTVTVTVAGPLVAVPSDT